MGVFCTGSTRAVQHQPSAGWVQSADASRQEGRACMPTHAAMACCWVAAGGPSPLHLPGQCNATDGSTWDNVGWATGFAGATQTGNPCLRVTGYDGSLTRLGVPPSPASSCCSCTRREDLCAGSGVCTGLASLLSDWPLLPRGPSSSGAGTSSVACRFLRNRRPHLKSKTRAAWARAQPEQ
jgi:hypothetical protein